MCDVRYCEVTLHGSLIGYAKVLDDGVVSNVMIPKSVNFKRDVDDDKMKSSIADFSVSQ